MIGSPLASSVGLVMGYTHFYLETMDVVTNYEKIKQSICIMVNKTVYIDMPQNQY